MQANGGRRAILEMFAAGPGVTVRGVVRLPGGAGRHYASLVPVRPQFAVERSGPGARRVGQNTQEKPAPIYPGEAIGAIVMAVVRPLRRLSP